MKLQFLVNMSTIRPTTYRRGETYDVADHEAADLIKRRVARVVADGTTSPMKMDRRPSCRQGRVESLKA